MLLEHNETNLVQNWLMTNEIGKGPMKLKDGPMKLQKFKWANQVKSRPMKLRKFKWANEVENWVVMLINGKSFGLMKLKMS